jgi:hypothetical protein
MEEKTGDFSLAWYCFFREEIKTIDHAETAEENIDAVTPDAGFRETDIDEVGIHLRLAV